MPKLAVVYRSGTGNTEKMAQEILKALNKGSCEANLFFADQFDESDVEKFDGFAFGCPAMGNEELEESEFEPMFESVENKLSNKPVALFGSYSRAEGQRMEDWQKRCEDDGINLVCDGLIAYDDPDQEALNSCKKLAEKLLDSLN